jgi:uncharacterized protein involved in outer membrane biogenesis
VDLGGHASVETPPVRAWFVLTGSMLDLDAVMGVLPESPEQAKAAPPPPNGELVPEATRRQLQAASATGTVAIATVKGGRLELKDVKARAVLSKGTLTLQQLDASLFGGKVSGSGTTVSLAEKVPTWKLAANLAGVDLAQAQKAFAGQAPLLGKLDGTLDVSGAGTDWNAVKPILTGLAALAVKDGTLTTAGLGDQVLGGLAKGLQAVGRGSAAEKVGGYEGGKTAIKDLAGKFVVKDGFLTAQSPFKFGSGAGQVTLGGRIGLGGELDLSGGVAVPKAVLAKTVTVSGLKLPETLDVPVGLGGSLGAPSVSVKAGDAVSALVKGQVQETKKAAQQEAEKAGKKALEGLFDRFKK